MIPMKNDLVASLEIEDLLRLPSAEELKKAIALIKKTQNDLYLLVTDDDSGLMKLKIGTALTIAVLRKIAEGKKPKDFSKTDWAEIADTVAEQAVRMDGEDYTLFVFGLYADYIQWSASLYKGKISDDKEESIEHLAEDLRSKSKALKAGEITEPQYVEDCLWISLEAMVKLLSSLVYLTRFRQAGDAVEAAAMFSFEYGRLMLYSKEQALLSEYLRKQEQLDQGLMERFASFKYELAAESERFDELIRRAYDPGFRNDLMASIELAAAAGVNSREILKSEEEIDSFFLG